MSELQLTIRQDPGSGWWVVAGPAESGIYIANPSLELCISDILPTWRTLEKLSPSQVPPVPAGVAPTVPTRWGYGLNNPNLLQPAPDGPWVYWHDVAHLFGVGERDA